MKREKIKFKKVENLKMLRIDEITHSKLSKLMVYGESFDMFINYLVDEYQKSIDDEDNLDMWFNEFKNDYRIFLKNKKNDIKDKNFLNEFLSKR